MRKIKKRLTRLGVASMGEYEELMDQLTFFLRTKKLQDELLDVNGMILTWIFHYCEKNNIPIYNDDNVYYLIQKARKLMTEINPTNRHLTGRNNNREANRTCVKVLYN